MKDIQLRNVINKINNDINNNINEEEDLLIKEKDEDNYEDLFIEGKSTTFKLNIAKQFIYLDEHYILATLLKFFFGIITLFLPLILIIIFSLIEFPEKNDYIFFPCFLSLSLILASLLILLVIKIGEGCQINGLLIYSWERKNIFQIINSIIFGFFLLWFLFISENFINWFNLLKEKVAQSNSDSSSSQLFNKGSYTERILFILYFWDLEKDNNGEYIHKKLEYFEYEDSVFSEFHEYIEKLFIPVILLGFYNLIKIIFFKNKRQLLSFIINLVIISFSFFIMLYPIDIPKKNDTDVNYFSNVNCKYFELIAYTLIILTLIIKCFFMYWKLIKKKYISRKTKNNKLMTIISIFSFLINLCGYVLLLCAIFFLTFDKIDQNFTIEKYQQYWNYFYMAGCLILFGYAFIFGNYFYNLVYYPIAYEISPHVLKNRFYVNSSGTIIETKKRDDFNLKFKRKGKENNLLFSL